MKKRLLAASLSLTLLLSTGAAVSADKGGVPSTQTCHGQVVSGLARSGTPPSKIPGNPGAFNKSIECAILIP